MWRAACGRIAAAALAGVAALAACGDAPGVTAPDGGPPPGGDGGRADAQGPDARPATDSGPGSGDADAGPARPDAGDGGPVLDAGAPDAGGRPAFAVVSLNLHCFVAAPSDYPSVEARLAAVAARAVAEGAEVLLLQEVCEQGARSALGLLLGSLEAESGAPWVGQWAYAHDAWVGTADEAREGVAVVARGALEDVATRTFAAQSSLVRLGLFATVTTSLGRVRVASLHLDHADAQVRRRQAQEAAVWGLLDAAAGGPGDLLLAGDLNDREGGSAHAALLAQGYLDATAALPADRIDHVLVHRTSRLRPVLAALLFDAPGERVSDHPGALVRWEAATPEAAAWTTLIARHDAGFGHFLSVRGDASPLSWTAGLSLVPMADAEWRFVTTELASAFSFKLLVDDARWQLGDDVTAEPGTTLELDPTFE